MQNKANESGRSLLEMIAILAIMILLVLGGLRLYGWVMIENEANVLHDDLMVRGRLKQEGRPNQKKNFSVDMENKTRLGTDIIADTTKDSGAENYHYSFKVIDIRKEVCDSMIKKNYQGATRVTINDHTYAVNAAGEIDPDIVCDVERNSFELTFNKNAGHGAYIRRICKTDDDCPPTRRCINGVCKDVCPSCDEGECCFQGSCTECDNPGTHCDQCPADKCCDGDECVVCPDDDSICPLHCCECDQDNDVCTKCKKGYHLTEAGTCVACPRFSSCPSCNTQSDFECISPFEKTEDACICPAGYKLNVEQKTCTPCPAGTYSSADNSEECTPCPCGQYNAHDGEHSCSVCEAGTYAEGTGNTSCETLPDHATVNGDQCGYTCDENTIIVGGTCKYCYNSIPNDARTECICDGEYIENGEAKICCPGTVVDGNRCRITEFNTTASRPHATWVNYWNISIQWRWKIEKSGNLHKCCHLYNMQTWICGGDYGRSFELPQGACLYLGVYGPNRKPDTVSADTVYSGFYTKSGEPGHNPSNDFVDCGFVVQENCTAASSTVTCSDPFEPSGDTCVCKAGYYIEDGVCKPCPIGTYKESAGFESCTPCDTNKTTAETGSTSASDCSFCPAGYGFKNGSCVKCTGNSASNNHGICVDCNNGVVVPDSNHTACTCFTNASRDMDSDTAICTCDDGYFSIGETCVKRCSTNSDCNTEGTDFTCIGGRCEFCPAGSEVKDGKCVPCTGNTISKARGYCVDCGAGTQINNHTDCYCDTNATHNADNLLCYCNAGYTQSGTTCGQCAAGYYKNTTGNGACTQCGSNATTASTGSTAASACVCNKGYEILSGSTACQAVNKGWFKNVIGNSGAQKCPAGTYNDVTGATACKNCPAGTTSTAGQASCSNCDVGKCCGCSYGANGSGGCFGSRNAFCQARVHCNDSSAYYKSETGKCHCPCCGSECNGWEPCDDGGTDCSRGRLKYCTSLWSVCSD